MGGTIGKFFSVLGIVAGSIGVSPVQAVEICSRSLDDIKFAFEDPSQRMGFENQGGLMNGGTCWWHSRLQRAAIYLARFRPELQKPDRAAVERILKDLVHQRQVVEIPGYGGFAEFTRDHQTLVQRELDLWQIRDGFLNQQWIRGLSGRPRLSSWKLEKRMNRVYLAFKSSKPGLWVMAQMRGITSHALLLLGMEPTGQGFRLSFIDSNFPDETREVEYRRGDRTLDLGYAEFIPYAGFRNDFRRIAAAIDSYCGRGLSPEAFEISDDLIF
jgi:hypothetical protein